MLYIRALCERAEQEADPGTPIRFTASTEGTKRDGKDLKAVDWRLDNYLRNPVVLWAHDYTGRTLPIGRASVTVDKSSLLADVTFDQQDDFARTVESKYRRGYLSAVSVGWDERDEGLDLLDISAVPVPGDPDALMERQVRVWRSLLSEIDTATQGVDSGAVATQSPQGGEDGGQAEETMTDSDNVRIGAVLNKRNKDDLTQAMQLIQGVIDRAAPAEPVPEDPPTPEPEPIRYMADLEAWLGRVKQIQEDLGA